MDLPFGTIEDNILEVRFSTADFSVATVIAGIREHLDMFEEMNVCFLGLATDVPRGDTPVMTPVEIKASFKYRGSGDAEGTLHRIYRSLWKGVIYNFPDELEWAEAKSNYSEFIIAQADLIRAQKEND
jgi:hypothetical protein